VSGGLSFWDVMGVEGEASVFGGAVRPTVCPAIMRRPGSLDFLRLFRLLPDRVQVVELIPRQDLERKIKTLVGTAAVAGKEFLRPEIHQFIAQAVFTLAVSGRVAIIARMPTQPDDTANEPAIRRFTMRQIGNPVARD